MWVGCFFVGGWGGGCWFILAIPGIISTAAQSPTLRSPIGGLKVEDKMVKKTAATAFLNRVIQPRPS